MQRKLIELETTDEAEGTTEALPPAGWLLLSPLLLPPAGWLLLQPLLPPPEWLHAVSSVASA